MSLLDLLLGRSGTDPALEGRSESVRQVAARLDHLPPERRRLVAAFACLLARVAHADLDIDPAEVREMGRRVGQRVPLDEAEVAVAVEAAAALAPERGATDNFLVAKEIAELTSIAERRELLHPLFAVAAADGDISLVEEEEVRHIADELGLTHRDYVAARSHFRRFRRVLRKPEG